MKKSDFHFDLPKELIASEPLEQRSASRLMCLNRAGQIQHHHYTDLPDLLTPGDLLVFNNSKVIPARLYARKPTGGKVEILIERITDDHTALAHVKGAKGLKEGSEIYLSDCHPEHREGSQEPEGDSSALPQNDKTLTIGPRADDLLTLATDANWYDLLDEYGHIPLPPYMERETRAEDRNRYQTVYADDTKKGSVAAPTAGLHFDEALLERLEKTGIKSAFVTLHVGAGTFQPVREENIHNHKMHSEYFEISRDVIDLIQQTKKSGNRVIAVGTTSVRVLESVWDDQISGLSDEQKKSDHPTLRSSDHLHRGETTIFITPGYDFKIIDGLITNFHLPESTLIMLVSALMGRENTLSAYKTAVKEKYRFFSYGDGMLLL